MAGIAALLRQARKAAFAEDYAKAKELYAEILASPDKADDLDLRIRYAWCLQHLGDLDECLAIYREVVDLYRQQGEAGAAESLERTIRDLEETREEPPKPVVEKTVVVPLAAMDAMEQLAEMGTVRHLHMGEVLCRVGDPPDELWLLKSGKLRVELPEYDEPFHLEATEHGWVIVGEIGFYTLQRRMATVVVEAAATVYEAPAATIRERAANDPAFGLAIESIMRDKWVEPVLARNALFERINDIDRRRLAHAFEQVDLDPGVVLIEAGEEHDGAYMVRSGCMFFLHGDASEMDDSFESSDGHMLSIMPGEMVHLGGLLRGFSSTYRVVAATPVQLLRLRREVFEPFAMRRPWIIPAILKFSRRPAHLQVMQPEEAYLWSADRTISLRREV